jgi:outer membrane protein insertion porin family
MRRKKSKNPEVFGFRIIAATIGSYAVKDKILNSNSYSFINGVPYYERFFLGSENDIRGYTSRSISPLAPTFGALTTSSVVVANNVTGTPVITPGLTDAQRSLLTQLGTFTGLDGANPLITSFNYTPIGGDTQLLGNFEYRIPIFGPVSMAAFADIGSVFNIRKGGNQLITSPIVPDQPFLGSNSINNILFGRNVGNLDFYAQNLVTGAFLLSSAGDPITYNQYSALYCSTDANNDGVINSGDCPATIPTDLKQVFLRGNAQTSTQIRLGDSVFNKLGDFRSTVGLELRVQVPIVNVPFRLIFFYNPNGKFGYTKELPNFYLPGKKSGIKFSVGRTF